MEENVKTRYNKKPLQLKLTDITFLSFIEKESKQSMIFNLANHGKVPQLKLADITFYFLSFFSGVSKFKSRNF